MRHLHLVKSDSQSGNVSTQFGDPPVEALRLPVFAAHKRNLAQWLRNLVELRMSQKRPVELSYGVAREIADLIEWGNRSA